MVVLSHTGTPERYRNRHLTKREKRFNNVTVMNGVNCVGLQIYKQWRIHTFNINV